MTISSFNNKKSCFHFTHYSSPPHKKQINRDFLEWFIGFSEGDGYFAAHKGRLFFIINQQEEQILHYIRDNLGFGLVSRYANYSRYFVTHSTDIDRLISLFNGNLVLEKSKTRFSQWLGAKNITPKRCFSYSPSANGWLSGFIDGEGCFSVSRRGKDEQLRSILHRFIIDQKGERHLLECVGDFLQGGRVSERKERVNMWRYTCSNRESLEILSNYLRQYPLRTWKRKAAAYFFTLWRMQNEKRERPWVGELELRVKKLLVKAHTRVKQLKDKRLIIRALESSETARKTTFDFQETHFPQQISKNFLEWFIGFSQGNASWIESKGRLSFKIEKKGAQPIQYIQHSIGFATVAQYRNYWRYVVANRKDVDRLISIFNGNLLLPRSQQRFTFWCQRRNAYSSQQIFPLYRRILWQKSSWLAGYIDARGKIKCKDGSLVHFALDQLDGCEMLHEIRDFLQGGSVQPFPYRYRFSCARQASLDRLLEYLHFHPSQSGVALGLSTQKFAKES